jgi:hypothetical protein
MPDAVLHAVLRAGRTHPTPAGITSALRAAQLLQQRTAAERPALFNRRREADALLPSWPEPDGPGPIVIRIAVGESWCATCGAPVTLGTGLPGPGDAIAQGRHYDPCCAHPQLVAVSDLLPPEHYYIAN